MTYKKKLIEVALPLEDINREAAREKSIRHGHPFTHEPEFATASVNFKLHELLQSAVQQKAY